MFLGRTVVHGIYALCYLSRQAHDGPESAQAVADAVGMPPEHARKVLTALAAAGLIESVRGRAGGYALTRGLDEISLLDALDALHPDAGAAVLAQRACPVALTKSCCVQPGLMALRAGIRELFARHTLDTLLGAECRWRDTGHRAGRHMASAGVG